MSRKITSGENLHVVLPFATSYVVRAPQFAYDNEGNNPWYCERYNSTASNGQSIVFWYVATVCVTVEVDPDNLRAELPVGTYGVYFHSFCNAKGHHSAGDVPAVVNLGNGARYYLEYWTIDDKIQQGTNFSLALDHDTRVFAKYQKQYELIVETQYGNVTRSEWVPRRPEHTDRRFGPQQ
jgi:hypothetical protein